MIVNNEICECCTDSWQCGSKGSERNATLSYFIKNTHNAHGHTELVLVQEVRWSNGGKSLALLVPLPMPCSPTDFILKLKHPPHQWFPISSLKGTPFFLSLNKLTTLMCLLFPLHRACGFFCETSQGPKGKWQSKNFLSTGQIRDTVYDLHGTQNPDDVSSLRNIVFFHESVIVWNLHCHSNCRFFSNDTVIKDK